MSEVTDSPWFTGIIAALCGAGLVLIVVASSESWTVASGSCGFALGVWVMNWLNSLRE